MLLLDLAICGSSDVLRVLYFIKLLIEIVFIIIPIALIIFIMIDLSKCVISGDKEAQKKSFNLAIKRILYAVIVFCVPTIVSIVISILGDLGVDYSACLNNLTKEQIDYLDSVEFSVNEAEKYVNIAENELTEESFEKAQEYIDNVKDENRKPKLQNRLEIAIKYAEEHANDDTSTDLDVDSSTNSDYDNLSSIGNCQTGASIRVLSYEPDPSCAINFWGNKKYIYAGNFIYPEQNGLYLGAWPKNHNDIPTKISYSKTYADGKVIWPVTPPEGKYSFVYEHKGIDIMSYMGTPIYAPVDGQLVYSEWGHTSNLGSDETSYSITIRMDDPIMYKGESYDTVFLTHMSGIVYRCATNKCNKTVSKGELIGFIGNAAGDSETMGFAPHLHMTIRYYDYNGNQHALSTSDIQKIYNLDCGSSCKSINKKAGE